MGRWRVAKILGTVLIAASPACLSAQVGNCDFLPVGGNDLVNVTGDVTFITRPRLSCADGMRISADSLRYYGALNYFELWGRIAFENPEMSLESSTGAQYYDNEGRLTAQGAANLTRKQDRSTISGESLELLEQTANRPQQSLIAIGGRPHALLYPERREAAPADTLPFDVYAARIELVGKDLRASGDVEFTRGTIVGSANAVDYLGDAGQLVLRGSASLLTDDYGDLTGGLLVLIMPDGELREVTAREGGSLVSERVTVVAPMIWFQVSGGQVERLVGARDTDWVPPDSVEVGQPLAVSQDFTMRGDSLDLTAPGGALELVVATGSARAELIGGELVVPEGTPELARRDWIEGDTIEARFTRIEVDSTDAPPAAADTAGAAEPDARIERVFAVLGARAFYRMEADTARAAPDTTAAARDSVASVVESNCLAFHYVTGDSILISFEEGSVTSTEVMGQVKGQHWEPPAGCRADRQPSDSSAVRPSAPSPATPSPTTPPPPPPTDPSSALLPASRSTLRSFARWARAGRADAGGRP
jgi:lipopolysaccharide export system protein LptA